MAIIWAGAASSAARQAKEAQIRTRCFLLWVDNRPDPGVGFLPLDRFGTTQMTTTFNGRPGSDSRRLKAEPRGVFKTIAASIAAPIVCAVVSAVAGGIFAVIQTVTTVLRPGIIGFFAVIIGSVAGVAASKEVCDRFLSPYRAEFVFVSLVALVLAGLIFELVYVPLRIEQINSYVQLVVLAVASYAVFWKGEYV